MATTVSHSPSNSINSCFNNNNNSPMRLQLQLRPTQPLTLKFQTTAVLIPISTNILNNKYNNNTRISNNYKTITLNSSTNKPNNMLLPTPTT